MASLGLLMPAGSPIGSGGLYTPSAMAFGPDGNLYISGGTFGGNLGVRRYDSTTGAFIDFFANTGSDLYVPIGITFGPDNNLYVATQNAANVSTMRISGGLEPARVSHQLIWSATSSIASTKAWLLNT